MMNRLQYLLTKLAEEASEIAQIALKTQQFGANEVKLGQDFTNKERIKQEVYDLMGVICMLNDEFDFNIAIDTDEVLTAITAKIEKVNHYYGYSQSLGMVE